MDGIIFDLDGTLWDSTDLVAQSWNEVLRKETDIKSNLTGDDLKSVFGKPLEEIFSVLFPDVEDGYLMSISEKLYGHQYKVLDELGCDTYIGVQEVFERLSKKMPIYIVSNCQAGYIEIFLKVTNLGEYITDHTCPGDTGMFKAENILLIMERNNLHDVIYVGDTAGDKNACDKAQIPMIYAKYGFGEVEGAAKEIDTIAELLDIDLETLL